MTTINQKDADQDQLIALLTHRIEDSEKMAEELRDRIGIALAAEAKPAHAFTDDSLTGTPCATSLVNSFVTEVTVKSQGEINGRDDTTQQEVMLQLQGN